MTSISLPRRTFHFAFYQFFEYLALSNCQSLLHLFSFTKLAPESEGRIYGVTWTIA